MKRTIIATLVAVTALAALQAKTFAQASLLNVSYDPTRELYQDFNAAFAKYWQAKTGQDVTIKQSHGGSGAQARAVIDGLDADVVTLALAYDIDAIAADRPDHSRTGRSGCRRTARRTRRRSCSSSAKGNPKGIKDWDDLAEAGRAGHHAEPENVRRRALELPRRVGLRAEAAGRRRGEGAASSSRSSTRTCRCSTPARAARRRRSSSAASATCCSRGRTRRISRSTKSNGQGRDRRARRSASSPSRRSRSSTRSSTARGTRAVAEAYLQYLYSPEGQEIAAKHHYRPRDPKVAAKYADSFAKVKLFTIDETFGGWQKAQKTHFADGGMFDQIYKPAGRTPMTVRRVDAVASCRASG